MCFRNYIVMAGLMALAPALGGCSLEAAMITCADCGEVRSITPRIVRNDIRLPTLDEAYAVADTGAVTGGEPVVFHIRVRMDRGGSRDFIVPGAADLQVGDRVEIRDGSLTVRTAPSRTALSWS